jgi:hypothetical protein
MVLVFAQSHALMGGGFFGVLTGLPLAIAALLLAILGRWRGASVFVSMTWGFAWIALAWNIGWCTFILYTEGVPDLEFRDPYAHSMHTELNMYIACFGPGTLLSICAVLISGRTRQRLRRLEAFPPKCEKCDYLLTGLVEPRCPECGTPFEPMLLELGGDSTPTDAG